MEFYVQNDLATLKRMSAKVNWKVEEERQKFRRQFMNMIRNWKGQLPDLGVIFRREQMDWLITQFVTNRKNHFFHDAETFIEFVIRTGYEDVPDDYETVSRRTTPLHHADRQGLIHEIRELFKIYNSFDVNCTDEFGLSHFHIACENGCHGVVQKFLELGQDPDLVVEKTGDTPLHLAETVVVAELLLRNGANPNSTNARGSTPLHVMMHDERKAMAFFNICDDVQKTVQVNIRDNEGNVPLHMALSDGNEMLAEILLIRGADPNLANANGLTPVQIILKKDDVEEDFAKLFFEIIDERHQTIQVNARDELGLTPLQWAVVKLWPNTVDLLLDHGADLSSFAFPAESHFIKRFNPNGFDPINCKLRLVSGVVAVVERLDKKGYKLDPSDALIIVSLFAKHNVFRMSNCHIETKLVEEFANDGVRFDDYDVDGGDDDEVEELANDDMRFYYGYDGNDEEFVNNQIRFDDSDDNGGDDEEAEEFANDGMRFDYGDDEEEEDELSNEPTKLVINPNLCDELAGGFVRRWALDTLFELIRYKLPILCCEIIIEQLTNEECCNFCLAAIGKSL